MPANPQEITSGRHPIYTANLSQWIYFADHAAGGPLYSQKINPLFLAQIGIATGDPSMRGPGRYIVKHPLEDSSDYLTRLSKAPSVNLCGPAIDMLAGTVGSADSVSMDLPNDFEMLLDDCDLMGDSCSQFMLSARTHAAIFGHTFLLCDSTKAAGEIRTMADVINQGVRPYFREILPANMLSWRLDSNGKPMEVLFRIPVEAPGSLLDAGAVKDQQYEFRFWSKDVWVVYRQVEADVVEVERGINPLHEIPVAVLYHRKIQPFLGESLLKESARFSHLLSNWLSDLDATMTMQSFSQACLRSTDAPSKVGVGSARILHLQPDRKEGDATYGGEDFFYRSPDAAPLQTMWDSFYRMIDMANSSMGLQPDASVDKTHPESGISRAWRWHSTEKLLTQLSVNEQEAVRLLLYFAARWKGQDNFTGSVVYGTNFDMFNLESDIANLVAMQAVGLPPTAQYELRARAIRKSLPNLDPTTQEKIDQELDAMALAPVIPVKPVELPVVPPTPVPVASENL